MAVEKENKLVRGNDLTYIGQQIKENFVAKEDGKGLSTNDYTTDEKIKLADIEAGAQKNVNADWDAASGSAAEILNKPTIPEAVQPATANPLMDGTAAVGTELAFARGDHRHPSDTNKANVVNPILQGDVFITKRDDQATGQGSLFVNGVSADGDLVHNREIGLSFESISGIYAPQVSSSRGTLRFNASVDPIRVDSGVAVIIKGGTIAMTDDIEDAVSGKANAATTLSGYGITDAYTIAEANAAIANALKGGYTVVATLPTASADTMGKIYLVPMTDTEDDNVKEEYFTYLDEDNNTYKWEKLGTTKFDNSDYEERLAAAEITTLLNL